MPTQEDYDALTGPCPVQHWPGCTIETPHWHVDEGPQYGTLHTCDSWDELPERYKGMIGSS